MHVCFKYKPITKRANPRAKKSCTYLVQVLKKKIPCWKGMHEGGTQQNSGGSSRSGTSKDNKFCCHSILIYDDIFSVVG